MWWASVVNAACGDCLASSAIRRRRVEMGSRLGVPGIFPSDGLMARHPLPSAGSLGSVPPRRRYYEVLRLPSTPPAALRCLRTGGIPVAPAVCSLGRRVRRPGPGVGHPVLPPGLAEKMEGPPRFLGDLGERALLSDPGGIAHARPLRRRDAAFRQLNDVGSRDDGDFGAQSHGPLTGCLRFAARVAPAPRKTRFRPLAKLYRAGLVTRRVPSKGFRLRIPLSQAFLAHSSLAATPTVPTPARRKSCRAGLIPNDYGVLFVRHSFDNCHTDHFTPPPGQSSTGGCPARASHRSEASYGGSSRRSASTRSGCGWGQGIR
jgi:hypothetical protein